MALLCQRHRLLFIMTPRTGCTAIGELLQAELGATYLPEEDVTDGDGRIVVQQKHSTLKQLAENGYLAHEERQKLFVIASVRNPFDSLVSLYTKKSKTYQPLLADPDAWVNRIPGYADDMRFCQSHTFDEWVQKSFAISFFDRLRRRGRRSLYRKYVTGVDMILRYEALQQDLDKALNRAGITDGFTIPKINTTQERKTNYREYYTQNSRRIVEQAFGDELKQYSYSF